MSEAELLGRVAAYLLSCHALGFGAWALAEPALPRTARVGLRLLAVLAGQWMLTAVLVQTLGLLGMLGAETYLAASCGVGAAVLLWRRGRRPHQEYCRLLRHGFRQLIAAPRWGLGWLTCFLLLALAGRFLALPQDIDALSLHGPMIVEWVQQGRIGLTSHWNYPQGWEYQQVPGFLLLRSDLLAMAPALAGVAALLLALREVASRLRFAGYAGYLLAVAGATVAAVWRDPFKNDPVFAVALLLGVLAVERRARGGAGAFWLAQLAAFLILGTKPSGFLYAAALGGLYLLAAFRSRQAPARSARRLLGGLAITGLLQVSAAAVQLRNLAENGNPIFPIRLRLAGFEILPAPFEVAGTSILDHASELETWRQFLRGGRFAIGAEWPFLLLLLAAAALLALVRLAQAPRKPLSGEAAFARLFPFVVLALWGLYTATPWSCGLWQGSWDYLANGSSLRYAIAPIGLTYLAAAAVLRSWIGKGRLNGLLALACPLLILFKWTRMGLFASAAELLPAAFAVLALYLLFALSRAAGRPPSRQRRGVATALIAAGLTLLAFLYVRHLEAKRDEIWLPAYREVWQEVWRRAPAGSRVAVNQPRLHFRYALYGPHFDHRLLHLEIGKGRGGQIPDDVSHIYVVPPVGGADLATMVGALEARGFALAAYSGDGRSALLARSP